MNTLEFLRQFRLAEYAIFDLGVSFLGMYLLSPSLSNIFSKLRIRVPKENWLFLTLPMGILVHVLVGSMTPMTQNFLDMSDHYVLKIIILISFVLGVRGIKIIKK